jgi:FkbM family methyltransferase
MSMLNTLKFITSHPVNNGKKIAALTRFFKWQLGSRLVPGSVVYNWINGSKFLVETGETGLTGNIYTGLHEFPDMAYLLHVLRPDDLFVDVGANVGSYTILACSAIGARGYAFEPIPQTYKRLVDNLRINNIVDRVACPNIGIGSEEGVLTFAADQGCCNHALAHGETSEFTTSVNVSTLDKALNDDSPSLIKIDVEGYERPVLDGAEKTLACESLHSVILELNGSGERYGFDESQILQLMFDYGFRSFSYDPFSRKLVDLDGKNLESGNTLFIRDKALVQDKLYNSPKFEILGMQI